MPKKKSQTYQNRQMTTSKSSSSAEQYQWHFSGESEYFPLTVTAATYEQAVEKWKKQRRPLKVTSETNSST